MAHAAFHIAIDMHVRIAISAIEKMHRMRGHPLLLLPQHDDSVCVSPIETISSWLLCRTLCRHDTVNYCKMRAKKIVAACGASSNAAAWLSSIEMCELVFLRPVPLLRPPGRQCVDVLFDDFEDTCSEDSNGNGDGVVGPGGDVDEDGIVCVNDLLMVIDSWSPCE